MRLWAVISASLCTAAMATSIVHGQSPSNRDLRPLAAFSDIQDPTARSRALFTEIAQGHHQSALHELPSGERPALEGNDEHPHIPATWRGEVGAGIPGAPCTSCHTERNFTLLDAGSTYRSIPGHPRWGLAPMEMAWDAFDQRRNLCNLHCVDSSKKRVLAALGKKTSRNDVRSRPEFAVRSNTGFPPRDGIQSRCASGARLSNILSVRSRPG